MTKRNLRMEWTRCAENIRRIILDELGGIETPKSAYDFQFSSPYGPVGVSIHRPSRNGEIGWMPCRLSLFGSQHPNHWYGWDHWKQNLHFFGGEETWMPSEIISTARQHLFKFTTDRGYGFPPQSEIDALVNEKAERDRVFSEFMSGVVSRGVPNP